MEKPFPLMYNKDYPSSPLATQIPSSVYNPIPMYVSTYITHPLLLIPELLYIQMSDKSSKDILFYSKYSSINDTTGIEFTFNIFTSSSTHLQTSAILPLKSPQHTLS